MVFLIIYSVFYFIPTILAFASDHDNKIAIFLLNLLLGWTVLGWIIAIVWVATKRKTSSENVVSVTNQVYVSGHPAADAVRFDPMPQAETLHASRSAYRGRPIEASPTSALATGTEGGFGRRGRA